MAEKKSFIVYYDRRSMFEALIEQSGDGFSYDRVGRLFLGLCDYAQSGETKIQMDGMTRIAYLSCIPQLQNDIEKYEAVASKNRINGIKGGRPPKASEENPKNPSGFCENPKNPSGFCENPKKTKKADTDTDTVTDTDTETETETDTDSCIRRGNRKRFSPPTIEEIKAYCSEEGYNKVNAEIFHAHYESNGWMVGKNRMKDWKAAVRRWEKSEYGNATTADPSRSAQENYADFFPSGGDEL
jgi:hypothetical protein